MFYLAGQGGAGTVTTGIFDAACGGTTVIFDDEGGVAFTSGTAHGPDGVTSTGAAAFGG